MNNLIPYISSEPPPISNESFDHESYNTDLYSPYKSKDSINNITLPNEEMEIDSYSDIYQNAEPYQYENYGRDNDVEGSRNPIELYEYIEQVIVKNNLRPDMADSSAVNENDNFSDHSHDGEFDDYISKSCFMNNFDDSSPEINKQSTNIEICSNIVNIEQSKFNFNTSLQDKSNDFVTKSIELKIDNSIENDENEKFDDFGDFAFISENPQTNDLPSSINEEIVNTEIIAVNYFSNSNTEPPETKSDDFADFTDFANFSHEGATELKENYETENKNPCNFDDDFEEFATFENSTDNTISSCNVVIEKDTTENPQQTLKNALEKILTEFSSLKDELNSENETDSSSYLPDGFVVNETLFNDTGLLLWKELTNYDYSPAFIFQWMQSATYEKFMSAIGPEYKEILSSHRAALPLFSVNLTPIEPVPADNYLSMNASASSSNIDLTLKDDCIVNMGERNSAIDFKNLEDEFIFDKFSNPTETSISDNTLMNSTSMSMSNLSSTVIQSERFGILKSILKPLNSSKASSVNKPISPQVEAVIKDLPDLSYMSSKVLMFPVISTCDVEDNI